MPQELARQWFVPGEGIDRHVISADIQRYLGNDATVRPGLGSGEHQGVQGYWIKAYRNLTSAMIADLRADSSRWRQEQRQTGTREPYVGSTTYNDSSAARVLNSRRDADSPAVDGPYGLPPAPRNDRIPVDNRMQIDPPQPSRGAYPPDSRVFPSDARNYAPDSRPTYPQDTSMSPNFGGRPPVSAPPFGQEPRYAPSYPQPSDGAPPGYVRQGNYFVPVSSYEPAPPVPTRTDNYGPASFGQPQQGREPRGYQPPPEYADARYAYPSPATTVSSVSVREREPVSSPPQPSNYGPMPSNQYDNYGGRPLPSVSLPTGGSGNRTSGNGVFGRMSGTAGAGTGTGSSRSGRR